MRHISSASGLSFAARNLPRPAEDWRPPPSCAATIFCSSACVVGRPPLAPGKKRAYVVSLEEELAARRRGDVDEPGTSEKLRSKAVSYTHLTLPTTPYV